MDIDSNSSQIIQKTQKWLEEIVIGLNLCPFAKSVHIKKQIGYFVSNAKDTDVLRQDLINELQKFSETDPLLIDTSLLIHPKVLNDFLDYNDFLSVVDSVVNELNLEGVVQVASFHPEYQFAGTGVDDVENYTNRSPYPMLHLLREDSLSRAIDSYPDVEGIPERNIQTLRSLSPERLRKLKELL